jgi:phage gpG-like protein
MELTITIDTAKLRDNIDRMTERMINDEPLLQACSARVQESIAERFLTRGHGEWAAVKESTYLALQRWSMGKIRGKKKKSEYAATGMVIGSTLYRNGYLMRSFGAPAQMQAVAGQNGSISLFPHKEIVSSHVAYASYHQTGTPKMVARPIFKLTDAELSSIVRYATNWYMKGTLQS